MACSKLNKDLRFIVIGKTGTGKSKTANTIIGRNVFLSKSYGRSVTNKCAKIDDEVCGRNISIVDTPGLFDTDSDQETNIKEIAKCMLYSDPGPHAILFITPIGRFTEEEIQTIKKFVDQFGQKLMRYVFIIFTRFDDWKRDNKDTSIEFDKYIDSLPPFVKDFVRNKCGNRFLPFDNNLEDSKQQVETLLNKIDNMVEENDSKYYTNEDYAKAAEAIKRKADEHERVSRENHRREMEEIESKIKQETNKRIEEIKAKMTKDTDEQISKIREESEIKYQKEKTHFLEEMGQMKSALNTTWTDAFLNSVQLVGNAAEIFNNITQVKNARCLTAERHVWNRPILPISEQKTPFNVKPNMIAFSRRSQISNQRPGPLEILRIQNILSGNNLDFLND